MFNKIDRYRQRKRVLVLMTVTALWTALAMGTVSGQDAGPPAPMDSHQDGMGPPPMERRRPPMEQALHVGPHGRWWNDPEFVKLLELSPDQQKKMEDVFEQSRPSLTDLSGQLRAEEGKMLPLLAVDQPDESKVLAEIDHVAQIRAELEKANARMLLGLRRVLTQDQWKKLQANDPGRHGGWNHGLHPRPDMN